MPLADRFVYTGAASDPATGTVRGHYRLGGREFVETIAVGAGRWEGAGDAAARLAYLLAGVSYYKTAAPPEVDLGGTPLDASGLDLLRSFYIDGLGEFAYRNGLDLTGLRFTGEAAGAPAPAGTGDTSGTPAGAGDTSGTPAGATSGGPAPAGAASPVGRPLIPFGGGIDSIVTVEMAKSRFPDAALFVLNRPGDRFAAIEEAAAVTGLPVVRAERELDPQVLRSAELGFLNGHVPITGILSAVAVLTAAVHGHDAVVMSNERSASAGNLSVGGRTVNHQWSKSLAFEEAFAGVVDGALGGAVRYFSALRPWSELWIAERFARLEGYHLTFRSCNRAFAVDPARRLDHWCGRCDKCCFIDLILAPFLPAERLRQIFAGAEPLDDADLAGRFRTLLALSPDPKPWECVGDPSECRAAAVLAAERDDRRHHRLLHQLVAELGPAADAARAEVPDLLQPAGAHRVPAGFFPAPALV